MASATTPAGAWKLDSAQEGLSSLKYEPSFSAQAEHLGPEDVLVDLYAASLNYRDIAITKGKASGTIPLPAHPDVIPGSDGAGVVVAVGSALRAPAANGAQPWLRPGARVVMHMVKEVARGADDDDDDDHHMPVMDDICSGLGQELDGTLCRRAAFHRSCVVPMPAGLTFAEAATLTCSGLTAWNALMGLPEREVKKGDWVLVQGTGGVSVAALQIAVAAGANVIAITSSEAKADRLSVLGARHVINYRKETAWGEIAKSLTPGQRGVDHVVDVVGPRTLTQSLSAVRMHGLITVTGMLGGSGDSDNKDPGIMSGLWKQTIYRGIILGSRSMFLDLVRYVEETGLKPAVDDVVFGLEEVKGAFERMERQEHFSKIVIKIRD